jgi:hypothetical protein
LCFDNLMAFVQEEEVGEAEAVLEDEGEDEEDEGVGVLEFYPSDPTKIMKISSL